MMGDCSGPWGGPAGMGWVNRSTIHGPGKGTGGGSGGDGMNGVIETRSARLLRTRLVVFRCTRRERRGSGRVGVTTAGACGIRTRVETRRARLDDPTLIRRCRPRAIGRGKVGVTTAGACGIRTKLIARRERLVVTTLLRRCRPRTIGNGSVGVMTGGA